MAALFDEVQRVIQNYHMDKIYYLNGAYRTKSEVEQIQMQQIETYVSAFSSCKSIALYGGGTYCEKIFPSLKNLHNISYIIDNSISSAKMKNGISIISIDDFISEDKNVEAVIITSWDYHEALKSELHMLKYEGIIVDLPEWTMKHFPDFVRPIYEYSGKMNYMQLNEMELLYRCSEGTKKYRILKKIIYTLCMIKDFLYAEKYTVEMERLFFEFGESINYRKAMSEIRNILEQCAGQQGKDVLFIHVVDSMSDCVVDDMPWLSRQSGRGIRFQGITVQYPCTHYAMNTMFTGKSAFDIEMTTENIEGTESELLRLIKEKYALHVISGNSHVLQEYEKMNESKSAQQVSMLAEILFEGLEQWKKNRNRNVIFMHSCGELHSSFGRVGSPSKLFLCEQMTGKSQLEKQFQEAVYYTDEELEWYDYFYSLTGMPMIIMGDHGGAVEEFYNYFLGVKKDITRGMKETITPAFIINRMEDARGARTELIPNTEIPQIIKAVLEKNVELLESIGTDIVELEFPPGYNEGYCKKFMIRGIWGQYEGFIGLRTRDEIYLVSASGRELYFRPDEWRYRNLAGNALYQNDIAECRKRLGEKKFPIEIFKMDKYKKHLELLQIYDAECYRKIMEKTDDLKEKAAQKI